MKSLQKFDITLFFETQCHRTYNASVTVWRIIASRLYPDNFYRPFPYADSTNHPKVILGFEPP